MGGGRYGRIRRTSAKSEHPAFEVDFLKEDVLHSHTATKNRSAILARRTVGEEDGQRVLTQ